MSVTRIFEKAQFSSNTRYVGVSTCDVDSSPSLASDPYDPPHASPPTQVHLEQHLQVNGKRSWIKTIIIQGFCALWIAPISVLLYLNWKGWIIGASAWCPGGKCYPRVFDPLSSVPQVLMAKFDHENHNLLGTLQFVAKALEVWFILISSWLVYLITMFLAGRKHGLPIAYLTRPNEFSEIAGLMDPLLWRTLPKPFRGSRSKKPRLQIWIFIGFTVFLCVICNLMGPATAVLVIPSLQWLTTDNYTRGVFVSYNADSRPAVDGFLWNNTVDCTEVNFANGLWSCTANPFASIMDSWIESYTASQLTWNGISQQGSVSFAFNSTEWAYSDGTFSDFLSWAPARQTVDGLSDDLNNVQLISRGMSKEDLNTTDLQLLGLYDSYVPLNNTVATFIQRNGPVTGAAANMWLGYNNETWWDTFVERDSNEKITKAIRCYENYNISNTPLSRGILTGSFTKCVPWGEGWNSGYQYGGFTIEGVYKSIINALGPSASFEIWTSDRAAFLENGDLPSGFSPDCLPRNDDVASGTTCDWDSFFAVDESSATAKRSVNVNTVQIYTTYAPVDGHPSRLDLMFDFIAYLNFTTYSLDPSPISNPLTLATTPDLPTGGGIPILVDPAWTLAAWSADDGGTMVANRSAALAVLAACDKFWELDLYSSDDPIGAYSPYIDYIALLPIIQTLSLIDYSLDNTTSAPTINASHPQLIRNARINVWAYGMSSRTAYFGVGVAGIGVIVAVCQFFLGLIDRRPYRSPTELLVAALEHAPSEEFLGKNHDELKVARTAFRVEESRSGHASYFRYRRDG